MKIEVFNFGRGIDSNNKSLSIYDISMTPDCFQTKIVESSKDVKILKRHPAVWHNLGLGFAWRNVDESKDQIGDPS